jgi:hypothetical protein
MAPRGRNLAAAAGPANSASNLPQSEAIRSPPLQPVSIPSQALPQVPPRPEIASASSSRSNKSRRSNQSNRSRTKGNSQFQDQLRAQALELAELRLLLLRQLEQQQSMPLQSNLHRRDTLYVRQDLPLESVEDIGSRQESHFVLPHSQPPAKFQPVLRRSAESDLPRNLSAAPSEYDPHWKPKATAPEQLDDGEEPTWITWKITVDNKLEEDAPQFRSELSRIRYVFGKTKGKANRLLRPYMRDSCPTPFATVQDMYAVLEELYTDPGEVEEAREDFRDLHMSRTQSFAEFKMEFLQLAGLATVSRTEYVDELYNKLTDKLKDALAPAKYKWGRDFALASLEIQQTDMRFTLNNKQRQRARILTATSSVSRGILKSADSTNRMEQATAVVQTTARPWSVKPQEQFPPARAIESRHSTPRPNTGVTGPKCYNCGKYGHMSKHCDQPTQQGMIQEIEEEEDTTDNVDDDLLGKEHA